MNPARPSTSPVRAEPVDARSGYAQDERPEPVLDVQNLKTHFYTRDGVVRAVARRSRSSANRAAARA
jgi:hypothetical protein